MIDVGAITFKLGNGWTATATEDVFQSSLVGTRSSSTFDGLENLSLSKGGNGTAKGVFAKGNLSCDNLCGPFSARS